MASSILTYIKNTTIDSFICLLCTSRVPLADYSNTRSSWEWYIPNRHLYQGTQHAASRTVLLVLRMGLDCLVLQGQGFISNSSHDYGSYDDFDDRLRPHSQHGVTSIQKQRIHLHGGLDSRDSPRYTPNCRVWYVAATAMVVVGSGY